MWFWWFMFFTELMTPLIMILFGRIMWKRCPKNINSIYGYRTNRSMKNTDTWKFAHEYVGKLWWRAGWITFILTIVVNLLLYGTSENTIGTAGSILVGIQLFVLIASIYPTEKALKKNFDEEGKRR